MSVQHSDSWIQRFYRRVCGQAPAPLANGGHLADVNIVPAMIVQPPATSPRTTEDWRDLLEPGRRVVVSWNADGPRGALMVQGEVRLIFDETVWIWLDRELADDGRPEVGQALQVLTPRADALRLIPGRLVEEGRGLSIQVEVSGRVSRVQRRDDVRARVKLPPVSAVRLSRAGQPVGLLGLQAIDLSAGGIRVTSDEPLHGGDRLRLALRLGQGEPLTVNTEILVGGLSAQGRFAPMPERDRQRIVQFVYRQELAQRREEPLRTAE
jgi:hypothetical protein